MLQKIYSPASRTWGHYNRRREQVAIMVKVKEHRKVLTENGYWSTLKWKRYRAIAQILNFPVSATASIICRQKVHCTTTTVCNTRFHSKNEERETMKAKLFCWYKHRGVRLTVFPSIHFLCRFSYTGSRDSNRQPQRWEEKSITTKPHCNPPLQICISTKSEHFL